MMKFGMQSSFSFSDLIAIVMVFSFLVLGQKVLQAGLKGILENLSDLIAPSVLPSIGKAISNMIDWVNKNDNCEESVVEKGNEAEAPPKKLLSPGVAVLVPSLKVEHLFPEVSHEEACSLLRSHGILNPNKALAVEYLDAATKKAIHDVAETLLLRYGVVDQPGCDNGVECPICLSEYPIEQFVSCRDGGHIFCRECVKRYATEMLFGTGTLGVNKETKEAVTELLCIADGCLSGFPQTHLEKVLTSKELERYGELQGAVNMTKASLDDLRSCPKCGFKALLPPTIKVFSCPADGCGHVSCTACGEQAHGKLTCEEAIKDKRDQTRHAMEEDMTAALLRVCPNPVCGKPMLKDGGCNKLNCSCGWSMCNVCKMRIDGYNHFCQTFECRHETCGKCSLWNSTDMADEQAIKRAQERGRERLKELILPSEPGVVNGQEDQAPRFVRKSARRTVRNRKGPFRFFGRSLRKNQQHQPVAS